MGLGHSPWSLPQCANANVYRLELTIWSIESGFLGCTRDFPFGTLIFPSLTLANLPESRPFDTNGLDLMNPPSC